MTSVDLSQFDKRIGEILRSLDDSQRLQIVRAVALKMGVAAESVVSPYPPQSRKPLPDFYTRQRKDGTTYLSKFKSIKQQAKVILLGRDGRIPYRRTGTLGRSITSDAENVTPDGADVVIGMALQYARFVIGRPPEQSHYHQGNWTPLADDIEKHLGEIEQAGVNEFLRQWRKLSGL